MGKTYPEIDDRLRAVLEGQKMFFVGTAPIDLSGHLNLSPKGLDTFRILSPRQVAYLDLTGSGIETIAHLRENGRITLAFCAFEGKPLVVRLYGRGRVVEPSDPEWTDLIPHFEELPGARAIIVVDLERIGDSCGYAVPLYQYQGQRSLLIDVTRKKGPAGMAEYQKLKNRTSIDGLDGLASLASQHEDQDA